MNNNANQGGFLSGCICFEQLRMRFWYTTVCYHLRRRSLNFWNWWEMG